MTVALLCTAVADKQHIDAQAVGTTLHVFATAFRFDLVGSERRAGLGSSFVLI